MVNAPAVVVTLLAPAASIDIPAVVSIVTASLESTSKVVVSISNATSVSPPIVIELPSIVRAPSASISIVPADLTLTVEPDIAVCEPLT